MTRYLVTGAGGQLGSHLAAQLPGNDVVALTRAELDITSATAVDAAVRSARPDVVLNAAAYTAVDAAETDEDAAYAVNAAGPAVLAAALAEHGGRLIHMSTDYVFDGTADRPYEPTDPTGPRTAYGRTKLAGETAALAALPTSCVVRSAWIYGGPGTNFVDTMIKLEQTRDTVDVVADQVGSPTWVGDLATGLVALADSPVTGRVLHYANGGTASWFDLAQAVFSGVGADPQRVRPVTSAEFVRPAPRPAWSVLSTAAWRRCGLPHPRDWRAALAACLDART